MDELGELASLAKEWKQRQHKQRADPVIQQHHALCEEGLSADPSAPHTTSVGQRGSCMHTRTVFDTSIGSTAIMYRWSNRSITAATMLTSI